MSAKKAAKKAVAGKAPMEPEAKRARVSQLEIPAHSLEESLRVARALIDNFGKNASATPSRVAGAMDLELTSSRFRMLAGASIAYGLTEGGYNAANITATDLAKRILKPRSEGDDLRAKREAFLKPRVPREFLEKYDGAALPVPHIAKNILEHDFGVPSERSEDVFANIVSGAKSLGLTHDSKTKTYVDLASEIVAEEAENDSEEEEGDEGLPNPGDTGGNGSNKGALGKPGAGEFRSGGVGKDLKKIFITHGKNRDFVDNIKSLLVFGELEPLVSVEKTTVSQPVPEKVMDDMRACSGAIIHVNAEQVLKDAAGNDVTVINSNVLIEIGAAMALYGRRFVLLVERGCKLPSNLQGLFEVRYKGEKMDSDETIELMAAIKSLKNTPLPD